MARKKTLAGPIELTPDTATAFKQLDYQDAFEGALVEMRRLRKHVADLSEELKQAQEHVSAENRIRQKAIEQGKAPWCPDCGVANCYGFCADCERKRTTM